MFGIMIALPREARHIVPHRIRIGDMYRLSDKAMLVVIGMGESARSTIRHHAESGQFSTLISLGSAVGLSPLLTPGMVCIPDEVVCDAQTIRCHQGLQSDFKAALGNDCLIVQKRLIHTSHVLTNLEEKESLYLKSRAVVADMESFLIGQEAFRHQLNFLAIRVVVDSLHLHIPQSLLDCCLPNVSLWKLLWIISRQPKLLLNLLTLSKHFNQAQKTFNTVTQVKLLQSN